MRAVFTAPLAKVSEVYVEQSSGFPELDQVVVDAFRSIRCDPESPLQEEVPVKQRFNFARDAKVEYLGMCSSEDLPHSGDVSAIRTIVARCSFGTALHTKALQRLNEVQPRPFRRISLQSSPPVAGAERAQYALDVFFNLLEAYPPDIAFEKLAQLIDKINGGFQVESIQIVGSRDGGEVEYPDPSLALKRADFVKRYLMAAGLAPDVPIALSTREPRLSNTPEQRAGDRVAEVVVKLWRRQVATPVPMDNATTSTLTAPAVPIDTEETVALRSRSIKFRSGFVPFLAESRVSTIVLSCGRFFGNADVPAMEAQAAWARRNGTLYRTALKVQQELFEEAVASQSDWSFRQFRDVEFPRLRRAASARYERGISGPQSSADHLGTCREYIENINAGKLDLAAEDSEVLKYLRERAAGLNGKSN